MRTIELNSVLKGYTVDQDKVIDPETTVKNALDKLAGHAEVTLERRANAIDEAFAFTSVGVGIDTSGKGLTEKQARASAIMEYAERHGWLSFDYQNYPGYRVASYRQLRAEGLRVPEADYFLYNLYQVDDPEGLREEIFDIPLKWITAATLTEPNGRPLWYPINWHNMLFTSNGLASGNTFEEAIVQGLCELIERENIYRFFVEQRVPIDVEPESISHPLVQQTLAASRAAGIEFEIKDISTELGVATFIVRGTRAADEHLLTHRGVGQGAHTEPEKALVRAISEYFEGYSSLAAAEEASPINIGLFRGMLPKKHYGFHALLNEEMMDQSRGTEKMSEVPNLAKADLKQEAESILGILADHGIEVAVIDKTHPGVGIPVVRLFAPKMRSCISTELEGAPDLTLSAVYFEAGNLPAAQRHHAAALDRDPTWRTLKAFPMAAAILPALTQGFDPANVWGEDYLASLVRIGKTKKGGIAMLERLGQPNALMGQLFGMMGGILAGADR